MLKTISHIEYVHFKSILKQYYTHIKENPHTLVARFFGLHKIKYHSTTIKKVYFVVMSNVFKTSREIHIRFDLKGSTVGRQVKKHPTDQIDSSVALKDLDFLGMGMKIKLPKVFKELMIKQIKKDSSLFQALNINDYSLLLGIHYIDSEEEARRLAKMGEANKRRSMVSEEINFNQYVPRREKQRPSLPFFEI
mmetsp:Transcript_19951/g.14658  ORF Transcript_19951/g.14658 Transcript_19951/m.14658 type:complete len:193 (+) Transcript_19951:54-632(+)|eukprot:CAMPEP_0202979496 /NCGR_PEP_ID=MMETSP1396-20130829/85621_1 /ASSEMBLY_ACC=CAM_ASM_000872 /TAXON_ID= /ORGANISM="Pseudokeronopsis sp., Strain Brazil" /LENGTH=192 /DNA_ID=CAMNT_0049718927 /DNA_START=707 /DNA_END=1285 /DNA_ORIENTATION=-